MATETLSLEAIQLLLSESRTRGGYLSDIRSFFDSGALAVDFTEKYPTKESGSLRNSVDQNVKKLKAEGNAPEYKVVLVPNGDGDKKHVVLINMEQYQLQSQENEA